MRKLKKQNVFLVSGRNIVNNEARGDIKNIVVCSISDQQIREYLGKEHPDLHIISVIGLTAMEELVNKTKSALNGENKEWAVLIDPVLEGSNLE